MFGSSTEWYEAARKMRFWQTVISDGGKLQPELCNASVEWMVYNYRKVSRRAVPLNSTTFYNFDPSTRVEKKMELCMKTNVSFPAFLLTYHIVMWGGGECQFLKALAEICHIIWRKN